MISIELKLTCFSVDVAAYAIAVDLNRLEVVFELDSASDDSADFHRLCIAWLVLHHCCLVDLDMVVVPPVPIMKKKPAKFSFSSKYTFFEEKKKTS